MDGARLVPGDTREEVMDFSTRNDTQRIPF